MKTYRIFYIATLAFIAILAATPKLHASRAADAATDQQLAQLLANPSCGDFSLQQQLISIDGAAGNLMGEAVAIDGNTAVVGMPGDDIGADTDAGSVLVYTRTSSNTWTLEAQLVAPQTRCSHHKGDQFGSTVAVSGNRIVVGAPYNDEANGFSTDGRCFSHDDGGAVYLFEFNGATWNLANTWLGGNGGDLYGWSVEISGDRIVVGVPGADSRDGADQGAIEIMEKDANRPGGWAGTGYIYPEPSGTYGARAGDLFGWSVAIRGDTIVAGAPLGDLGSITDLGTAYIYKRRGLGDWEWLSQLIPLNGAAGDKLGISVALSPDEQLVVIGAFFDDEPNENQGSVYVYRFNGTNYIYQAKLTVGRIPHTNFGKAVATNGQEIVIGANDGRSSSGLDNGAAYIFKFDGTTWGQANKLISNNAAGGDLFGNAVAIDGNTTLVGAQGDDYPGLPGLMDVGSAYIFGCAACPAITVGPAGLPTGRVGALYNRTFTATGGIAPYTFKIVAGALPPGLSLAPNGTLTGVPSATGVYTFTVRALMGNFCSGERAYTLTVSGACPAVTINPTNPTLPSGEESVSYSLTFTATGGAAPYNFSVTAGALPPGLALASSGTLSGIPPRAGIYNFTVRAVAANNCVGTRAYRLTITRFVIFLGSSAKNTADSSAGVEPFPQAVDTITAQQAGWSATGSLGMARSSFTATLLPSGKVLVAGGFISSGISFSMLSSAELYDPAAGTWAPTGNLNLARSSHTATLLPSGKVLIAGGTDNNGFRLDSAELYDPATGAWIPTGNLNVKRSSHTATLLPSGKVLVAAGGNNSGVLNSAELYDPATGTWTPTGNLNAKRYSHTASLLLNGKVLVAGGLEDARLNSAELYDPATAKWTATGNLNAERASHTASSLPNGKVLVVGGGSSSVSNSTELYDPATGAWAPTGNLNIGRSSHTATLLPSGKVLVAGGVNNSSTRLNNAELYDPATGAWTPTGNLNVKRSGHVAILLPNEKVLVAGGYDGSGYLKSAELFDSGAAAVVSVSAASFKGSELAPESIVAAFGSNLATITKDIRIFPLPTQISGVSVSVKDGGGAERLAPLFFISPGQINYQLPPGTANGPATLKVTNDASTVAVGMVEIASVAPGLFTADSTGQGYPAAIAVRAKADGTMSFEPIVQFDPAKNRFVPVPIDLGPATDQVFLALYGTGIRFRSSLSTVSCAIGGLSSEVSFAGAVGGLTGLDQVNVRLPRVLIGRGEVDVVLSVDGKAANQVRVSIR